MKYKGNESLLDHSRFIDPCEIPLPGRDNQPRVLPGPGPGETKYINDDKIHREQSPARRARLAVSCPNNILTFIFRIKFIYWLISFRYMARVHCFFYSKYKQFKLFFNGVIGFRWPV